MILGDNIFYGSGIKSDLKRSVENSVFAVLQFLVIMLKTQRDLELLSSIMILKQFQLKKNRSFLSKNKH